MARLVPEVDPALISLKPERDVAVALQQHLPDFCLIYHSYCWLRPLRSDMNSPLQEGEADFVVLDPRYGLLAIEVKGGRITHQVFDDTEIYYRELPNGDKRHIKNPFEQARQSLHFLERLLDLKGAGLDSHWFSGCYGYAVVFPDMTVGGPVPNDADVRIVFLAEHLLDMDRAVRGAFRSWQRRQHSRLDETAVQRCRERLRPVFHLIPARWRDLQRDEEQLVRLTDQQQIALAGLSEMQRVAVRGGAGTGKTLLALWRSVEFAREGMDTLLLCFNSRLSEYLNNRIHEELPDKLAQRITVTTFHALCRRFYREAGELFQPPRASETSRDFWENQVPNAMFDFILDQVDNLRFDAIIVDEAQDFAKDWWLVIESLLRVQNGPLYIFYDPYQNVFQHENVFPQTAAIYRLNVNCRNTQRIHRYSAQAIGAELHPSELSPVGTDPICYTVKDDIEQRRRCDETIKHWRREFRVNRLFGTLSCYSYDDSLHNATEVICARPSKPAENV
jgi:hypothetical protein